MAKKETLSEIEILKLNQGEVTFLILGTTPIILNRMSQKARQQILFPSGRKTAADKATSLKHAPLDEFRASPYVDNSDDGPTYLQHLASAFKNAMASSALDIPGATKTQIGRLAWVKGDRVAIYGVPQMLMSVVRSADMNRTPDIRTRVIVPSWACSITIAYVSPMLKQQGVANLMAAAGVMQGVGDWRQEKGKGNYGSFELVDQDDPRWNAVVKNGGRKVQLAAMENPDFYDTETEELYSWYLAEHKRRGFDDNNQLLKPAKKSRGNGKSELPQLES